MITFFTSLKPFRGANSVHQANALRTWRASLADCEIIVFDAADGGADLLAEVDATHVPDVARNDFGTPLISAMFSAAQRIGTHPILCYINGDIILLPDFAAALARLSTWRTFAAVGQRWDLDWDEPVDVRRAGWDRGLVAERDARGTQHDPLAMDYVAFRRAAVGPLPDFAVGRPAWDNFLIKHLLRARIPIVDLSRVVRPIHQNHDYAHVARRRGPAWEGPEADANRKLAAEQLSGFNPRHSSIRNAQWLMLPRAIVPAVTPRRIVERLSAGLPDPARDGLRAALMLPGRIAPPLLRFIDLYAATAPFFVLRRDPRRIAVVRTDGVGDFVLWLDGARAIRARYPRPGYHLTLVAACAWSDFAEKSELFDRVIAVDPARLLGDRRYRRTVYRELARNRFGTAINPIFSRGTWIDDVLVRATRAARRVGHAGDLSNASSQAKPLADRWYTDLVRDGERCVHDLEKNRAFARKFSPMGELRVPPLAAPMVERPAWLSALGAYFVLFPGAAYPIRRWPTERFAEIGARICAKTGWEGVVCGSSSDLAMAQRLTENAGEVAIRNACGRTSLQALAGVIADARLVVTNDTSAAHLAASLGTPVAVIVGGGHFGRFFPYPEAAAACSGSVRILHHPMPCYLCNWKCIHARRPDEPGPCVRAVTASDAWDLIEPMLAPMRHGADPPVQRSVTAGTADTA